MACAQARLQYDQVCAPLLRVLGALASPMASLGVPHVDVRHPATLQP